MYIPRHVSAQPGVDRQLTPVYTAGIYSLTLLTLRAAHHHMNRSFSFFIVTEELLSSPSIRDTLHNYDCPLLLQQERIVTFVLLLEPTDENLANISVEYDPLMLDILDISPQPHGHTTLLSITLQGRDVGCSELSFIAPQSVITPPQRPARPSPALEPDYFLHH